MVWQENMRDELRNKKRLSRGKEGGQVGHEKETSQKGNENMTNMQEAHNISRLSLGMLPQ